MAERPAKRQYLMGADGACPRLTCLVKGSVGLAKPLSPGAPPSCRVALQECLESEGSVHWGAFIASGGQTYTVKTSGLLTGCHQIGKEGIHLALDKEGVSWLGAVDAYGQAVAAPFAEGWAGSELPARPQQIHKLEQPTMRGAGWCGMSFTPGHPSKIMVCRSYTKELILYEDGKIIRCMGTLQTPSALRPALPESAPGAPELVVAEGHQISIWDLRAGERGGCVARIDACSQTCKVLCAAWTHSSARLLGTAGSDRDLTMWDPRKWTSVCRWSNCMRNAIQYVHFSKLSSEYCYLAGLDYEVVCGLWNRESEHRAVEGTSATAQSTSRGPSFRGDSRWLGVASASFSDRLAGLSESGNVYLAEFDV